MDELMNEAVSTEEISEDILFEGWGDGSAVKEEEPEVTEEETETESEEADQPEAEEAEDASDDDEEEGTEAEEAEEEEADQLFTLKHLDEVKEVGRDEVITLAQKGLDYDRIRTERDQLKAEKAALKEHEDFLKELAELAGQSVDDLMIATKARLIVNDEKKKGRDITYDQARYRVESDLKERKKAEAKVAEPAEPVVEKAEEPVVDLKAVREANFKRFIEAYPEVKSEDIPHEVWKEFGDGSKKELTDIYARYENKKLKQRIAELEQKPKRSTGSRRSNGNPVKEDDLFAGWG